MVAVEVLVLFPYRSERCAGAAHLVKVRGQMRLTALPSAGEPVSLGEGLDVVVHRAMRRPAERDIYLEVADTEERTRSSDEALSAAERFRRAIRSHPLELVPAYRFGASN